MERGVDMTYERTGEVPFTANLLHEKINVFAGAGSVVFATKASKLQVQKTPQQLLSRLPLFSSCLFYCIYYNVPAAESGGPFLSIR